MLSSPHSRPYLLYAPIDGLVVALQDVPDPVFAQQTMGPGIAIEPLGDTLYAPAAGKIIQCAATLHAVTIEIAPETAILLHLGIDTIYLNSEGLKMHVQEGQYVNRGDPIIRFDPDKLAQHATSLITPLVSIGERKFSVTPLAQGHIRAHDPLAKLIPLPEQNTDNALSVEKTML